MKLRINIDDKDYEVDVEVADQEAAAVHGRFQSVESAATQAPRAAVPAAAAVETHVQEEKVCRSPVSGIVASVAAQPGQTLQVGDVLLVLEAMKMETQVSAPVAGKVAAMKVKPGDSVQSGQVLVEFE